MSINSMSLFSAEEKKNLRRISELYSEELRKANADYKEVQKVQEKFAEYFDNISTKIIEDSSKPEQQGTSLAQRLYFTDVHKELIANNFDTLLKQSLVSERNYNPLCIECACTIEGLGLALEKDNSYLCWNCIDEDNYTDYNEYLVCKFTGGKNDGKE